MGIFSKKSGSVRHNYIQAPNTMLSFRKKLMSQSQEKLWIDGRTDGRTDKPYFIEPFQQRLGVQLETVMLLCLASNYLCYQTW